MIAGVALGVAQGALDDILAIAAAKVPLLAGAPLATNPHVPVRARHGRHRAARRPRTALRDGRGGLGIGGGRGAVHDGAAGPGAGRGGVGHRPVQSAVVETAYRAGGGGSLYADCPLQRRLRDVHAITQHFLVRPDTLTTAGAVLAGQDVDVPVF